MKIKLIWLCGNCGERIDNSDFVRKADLRKIVEGWQEWVDLMEEVGIDNLHPPTTKAAIEIRKVDIDGLKQLLDGRDE
jgi:hypothetical protein